MADQKSTGGAGRSFEFVPAPTRRPKYAPNRWVVWWWENDAWHRMGSSMPEGASASFADTERRTAGAIAMEAVASDDLRGYWGTK